MNRIMPWNNETDLAVCHDDMAALARDPKPKLFKYTHGVLLANSRNLRHSALNRDQFRGDFLVFLCGLTPYIFFRDLQPKLDGFPNIA